MGPSVSDRYTPNLSLPEALSAEHLDLKAKPLRLRLARQFERYAKRVLLHPLYPWVARWFLIGLFVTLTFSAFWGPHDARVNFAAVMIWIVWWPLLAVSYLLLGRVWCAVCPMGALSDLIHEKFGLKLNAPNLGAITFPAVLFERCREFWRRTGIARPAAIA